MYSAMYGPAILGAQSSHPLDPSTSVQLRPEETEQGLTVIVASVTVVPFRESANRILVTLVLNTPIGSTRLHRSMISGRRLHGTKGTSAREI